jgi:hypothetical protein
MRERRRFGKEKKSLSLKHLDFFIRQSLTFERQTKNVSSCRSAVQQLPSFLVAREEQIRVCDTNTNLCRTEVAELWIFTSFPCQCLLPTRDAHFYYKKSSAPPPTPSPKAYIANFRHASGRNLRQIQRKITRVLQLKQSGNYIYRQD